MDSITLPRGIGAERLFARALRAAVPLASLGVLGYLILGASHPGSTAIAVLVLFAFAFPLAAGAIFSWKSRGLSKMILSDVFSSLKLALALTATTMVFVRSGSQAIVYGSLLLLLFMASAGLRSHADRREERAKGSSSKALPTAGVEQNLGAEPTPASEPTDGTESPAASMDTDLKARLKSALPLLKRNS